MNCDKTQVLLLKCVMNIHIKGVTVRVQFNHKDKDKAFNNFRKKLLES